MTFKGITDPLIALAWLVAIEKIQEEGMQCRDEDKVRIIDFLLEGNARNWCVVKGAVTDHI